MLIKIEKFISDLENEIKLILPNINPLERLNSAYAAIDTTIVKVKEFLEEHDFADKNDEINFFKKFNPLILSKRIEETLKYNILTNKPIGTDEAVVNYFNDQLNVLQSFFRLNAFYYQYYKNQFNELDGIYFLRNAKPLTIPLPEIPEINNKYSTSMSYLFAKFIAYEKVQYFILEQISLVKGWSKEINSKVEEDVAALKWTGEVINIVEVAYGLWLTGQLNYGNAGLNQIVRWLEKNLDVNIGIIQRRFSEIERRKRLSPTKYIDEMKNSVLKKIERSNA